MDAPEFIIAALAIVGGLSLTAFIFGSIFKLIRTSIEAKHRGKEGVGDLVSKKEFIDYKLKVEKRIQTLEAIVVDQDLVDQIKLQSNQHIVHVDPPEEESEKRLPNRLRS
jgi:hypothetical protein